MEGVKQIPEVNEHARPSDFTIQTSWLPFANSLMQGHCSLEQDFNVSEASTNTNPKPYFNATLKKGWGKLLSITAVAHMRFTYPSAKTDN